MAVETLQVGRTSKGMLWTGRVLSALPVLFMLATGLPGLFNPASMKEGLGHYGYPEGYAVPIVILELVCVIIYAIPQTAVLGAILLTGYFGGATATHVRASESLWVMPVVFGVIIWLGLFFRDARVRALIPLRSRS